jgi:hypothetical protein
MLFNSPRFGVNYTPSKNWWYSWMDWDRQSIADDLQAVASLGLDHLRIHCLWPWFQPAPDRVRPEALDRLEELLDLADAAGLDVEVSVLDGWLSGINFIPAWQEDGENVFTSPRMIAAEKFLFQCLARRIGSHRRFMGFDLGNELGVLMMLNNPAAPQQADRWNNEMLSWCEALAPGKLHVNGVDHNHWFWNVGFTRPTLANSGALTSLHTYPFFTGMTRHYGSLGAGTFHAADYCIELARAFCDDPNRRYWIQEVGGLEEEHPILGLSRFAESLIRNTAGSRGFWGLTWWCSHDFYGRYAELDPSEMALGLLDVHNRPKPAGERIAALIEAYRQSPPEVIDRSLGLVLPDKIFTEHGGNDQPLRQFIAAFMHHTEQGRPPTIVLESRLQETGYLEARGISELERVSFYAVKPSIWHKKPFG